VADRGLRRQVGLGDEVRRRALGADVTLIGAEARPQLGGRRARGPGMVRTRMGTADSIAALTEFDRRDAGTKAERRTALG
jgi:hypothetical protein